MKILLKKSKIKLTGKKQAELHKKVWERDGQCCVICGAYVPAGVKAHHEPPKSHGGEDIEQNLVVLCQDCHYQRHHGAKLKKIKAACERYLTDLYGE